MMGAMEVEEVEEEAAIMVPWKRVNSVAIGIRILRDGAMMLARTGRKAEVFLMTRH